MPRTFRIVDVPPEVPTKPEYTDIDEAVIALIARRRQRPNDPESLQLVATDDDGVHITVTILDERRAGSGVQPAEPFHAELDGGKRRQVTPLADQQDS